MVKRTSIAHGCHQVESMLSKGENDGLARSNQHRPEGTRRQARHQGDANRRRVRGGLLAHGWTTEQILHEYDHLTLEDIQACLAYASEVLKSERVYLLPT